jgi:hypothetical protein
MASPHAEGLGTPRPSSHPLVDYEQTPPACSGIPMSGCQRRPKYRLATVYGTGYACHQHLTRVLKQQLGDHDRVTVTWL